VACPTGLTCVPKFGCTEPTLPTPPAPFKGKDCACDSYFPICVGAFWAYDVFDVNSIRSDKTWAFPFYGALNDTRHGLLGKKGYLQFRTSFTDFARRWVGVDGETGQQSIWWLKDEWFDTNEKLTRLTYFNERKLRFDDSHQDPAAPGWSSDFTQFDYPSPDAPAPPGITYKDGWRVVTPDFVMRKPQSLPPSRFPIEFLSSALCHERTTSLPDGSQAVTKYFCFVKGIGKVYELTPSPREEEVLRKGPGSFNVPNCSSAP